MNSKLVGKGKDIEINGGDTISIISETILKPDEEKLNFIFQESRSELNRKRKLEEVENLQLIRDL